MLSFSFSVQKVLDFSSFHFFFFFLLVFVVFIFIFYVWCVLCEKYTFYEKYVYYFFRLSSFTFRRKRTKTLNGRIHNFFLSIRTYRKFAHSCIAKKKLAKKITFKKVFLWTRPKNRLIQDTKKKYTLCRNRTCNWCPIPI